MIGYPLPVAQPVPPHMQTTGVQTGSGSVGWKMDGQIRTGDRVRRISRKDSGRPKPSVNSTVENAELGIVTRIQGEEAIVDFPHQPSCPVSLKNLILEPSIHPGITCDGCSVNPITGPRFKCKVCISFDYCQQCFYGKKAHPHPFLRINEAGVASIFAGKPGRHRELVGCASGDGSSQCTPGILDDWTKCVKAITVSSLETWAPRLVDGNPLTFWQSCGTRKYYYFVPFFFLILLGFMSKS